MEPANKPTDESYTHEERIVLASLRMSSRRTCKYCAWLSMRGQQRGCFPEGKYRKFLSPDEYDSGCERFAARDSKK